MKWRLWVFILGITFAYSSLVYNIYNLQVKKGSYYAARAASRSQGVNFLNPERGIIYFTDKNDNVIPAAMNKEYPTIFAVPKEIGDLDEAVESLRAIVGIDKDKLKTMLSKPNDLYELLATKASEEQVQKIRGLNMKGVYIENENFRFYPFGALGAQLLGFIGQNEESSELAGRYGLEFYYNRFLQTSHLYSTIDRNIQAQAEKILESVIKKYSAAGGTVIVQEPKTGKILALGNYPAFDPNNYSKSNLKNFVNPATQGIYEPGSVFKVITMAAGIDSGKITPNSTYYDSGSVTLNGKTIKNWDLKAHGTVTMANVIEQSINTGAAFAARKTGLEDFHDYLVKFGFGEVTGIGLPGEIAGSINNLTANAREIDLATAAFGQGVSVTPIELVNAISAIANNGILMRPYLNQETRPEEIGRVISGETAKQVAAMMASAVKKAEIAQIPKYEVAGKTGTAQIPDFKHGGYSNEFIHSYVGFAPASDPRFTILIKVDKPRGAPLAGTTVVPAFRELAEFILNYYNIPPDNP